MLITFGLFIVHTATSWSSAVRQDSGPRTAPQTIAVVHPDPLSPSSPLKINSTG